VKGRTRMPACGRPRWGGSVRRRHPSRGRTALALLTMMATASGVALAAPAAADSSDALNGALTSSRSQTSCAQLQRDPLLQQTTDLVMKSTQEWLDFTARDVPVQDPMPVLKDLGYGGGTKVEVKMLQGAGTTEAASIHGLLLEGYKDIPSCSYSTFGSSGQYNDRSGFYLTVIILGGP